MSFDKFAQLEAAIDAYGQRMARDGKDDPHTKIAHLMCLELVRDLKAERDAPSKFPGLVVRVDHNGKHMSATLSQPILDISRDPIGMAAESMRGLIYEVLKP